MASTTALDAAVSVAAAAWWDAEDEDDEEDGTPFFLDGFATVLRALSEQ